MQHKKQVCKLGDVITEVEGKKVTSVDDINEIKNNRQIGDKVKLKIYRDGHYKEIDLTLQEKP